MFDLIISKISSDGGDFPRIIEIALYAICLVLVILFYLQFKESIVKPESTFILPIDNQLDYFFKVTIVPRPAMSPRHALQAPTGTQRKA